MAETPKVEIRSIVRSAFRGLPTPVRRRLQSLRRGQASPLHEMLPLPLPETMHIDPANACNFRCTFCPTADRALLASVGRPIGMMDFDLFARIIDQLAEMVRASGRPLSILHLYKDGEPLLNKRFPEMAAYAKKSGAAHLVATTTNASMLTEDLAMRLIDSGIDRVRVSVIHLGSERYKELTQSWSDYEKIRQNVGFLYREKKRLRNGMLVLVKINDTGLSKADFDQFRRDFGDIADDLRVDSLMGWSLSESKDFMLGVPVSTGMDGVSPLKDRKVCPEPFSRLAVNFDGQVSVCCVDWSYGTIVGDLRHESLADVWNGERLRQFRLKHLAGRRSEISACSNCQYMTGITPMRDLDEHAERLTAMFGEGQGEPPAAILWRVVREPGGRRSNVGTCCTQA